MAQAVVCVWRARPQNPATTRFAFRICDIQAVRQQFFFDESGKSDLGSSSKSGQENLVVCGLLLSWDSGFWDDAREIWLSASAIISYQGPELELHGWELFGGRGIWKDAPDRVDVIDALVNALVKWNVPIYWVGLPITKLAAVTKDAWKKVLVNYLNLLSETFSTKLLSDVEVIGDQNTWIEAGQALVNENWVSFSQQRAEFHPAHEVHGLQIADIVAHLLYRSNKSVRSNTDLKADELRRRLASQIHHL
jgi:hypothetical protein